MNRQLRSVWPVLGLFLTWCSALLAYRLIPGTARVAAPVYWSVLPMLYGLALAYGYQRRHQHGTGSQVLRLGVVVLGALAAFVLNASEPAAVLFYAAAMVQVSLGVTLARERALYASLVISVLMLGFAASRPRSDTPLLLMLLPFFACFIFTLVANQFSQGQQNMVHGASRGGFLSRLGAGLVAIVLTLVLGITAVSVTPMGGMGPLQWKLDRDFLLELAGGKEQPGGYARLGGTGGTHGATSGGEESVFAGTLRRELGKAQTVGDVLSAVGNALKNGAQDLWDRVTGKGKHAAKPKDGKDKGTRSGPDDGFPWWLLLLPLLFRRVRLRLRVGWDYLAYSWRPLQVPGARTLRKLTAAGDRVLELRLLKRPHGLTWSQHAEQAPVSTAEGRHWLKLWATQRDELRYRGVAASTERARLADSLFELYLAVFETVRRDPAAPRPSWKQQLARTFALLGPEQAQALRTGLSRLRGRLPVLAKKK